MPIVEIKTKSNAPKYRQIVASIEDAILSGKLKKGDKLPSLNSVKNQFELSRDTVLMAFNDLKARGIIQSVVGKGFYVMSESVSVSKKVFLLFDEFNSFKEDLYSAFVDNLGENIQVDIFFHHFNYDVFSKLINDNAGGYSYYVVMPANLKDTGKVIERLPKGKVYILDQLPNDLGTYPAVYQNFKKDVYDGLFEALKSIKKYKKLILLFQPNKQPKDIRDGFELFCNHHQLDYEIIESLDGRNPVKEELYMVLDDRNLIRIIKKIRESQLMLSKDIGIISFNDTLLKDVVENGITTISTDFNLMGKQLAELILNDDFSQIENQSCLIKRNSL